MLIKVEYKGRLNFIFISKHIDILETVHIFVLHSRKSGVNVK